MEPLLNLTSQLVSHNIELAVLALTTLSRLPCPYC